MKTKINLVLEVDEEKELEDYFEATEYDKITAYMEFTSFIGNITIGCYSNGLVKFLSHGIEGKVKSVSTEVLENEYEGIYLDKND